MSDTNLDVRVFYNEDDNNYNNQGRLSPEAERLLTRLIRLRGTKQLAEFERITALLTVEVEIFRDWEETPKVARNYQSVVAGGGAKVGDLETIDVKVSGGSADPVISFAEKETDGDGSDVGLDDVPFW